MTLFQSLILGLIQGLTEFLPISSSGHLALSHKLLGFNQPPISYDISLHLSTLVAVIIYFKQEIIKIINQVWISLKNYRLDLFPKIVLLIIIATLPAIIFGLLIKDYMEIMFDSMLLTSGGFFISGFLLLIALKQKRLNKSINDIGYLDSIFIGIMQAVAILPSISRSGATITAALARKLKREDAFTFSFLLSIPAILGAQLLDLPEIFKISSHEIKQYIPGLIVAFLSGYLALGLFKKFIINNKLIWFSIYCIGLGLITLFLSM